jgi:hypothetical protein
MTDINKVIAFLTYCLGWADVSVGGSTNRIYDGASNRSFEPDSAAVLQTLLHEFLGTKYFIQINRGHTGLFHWQVMVGLQDLSVKGASWKHAQAEGEDLWDIIFDACVQAAKMHNTAKKTRSSNLAEEPLDPNSPLATAQIRV